MAGYPISELKKASESKGRDLFPIQQDGVTRQVELGILSNASKITASTSSGVITKEGSYVLQNNSAVINFTLNNAVGRAVSNNDYVDSASAAAGWIVKVINLSTRSHTVIAGSNSWTIAAGDVHEYYWTGSAWTFYNVVTESRLNNALTDYVGKGKTIYPTEVAVNLNDINEVFKKAKLVSKNTQNLPTSLPTLSASAYGYVETVPLINDNNARVKQELYISDNPDGNAWQQFHYIRFRVDGVWLGWRSIVTNVDLNNALANYRKIKEYTVTFTISGSHNTQEFKDFCVSKISEWENGDTITCINSNLQKSKIEVDKVNNNYFNLWYTTFYNSKPQYIRYINGAWEFYEINVTQV